MRLCKKKYRLSPKHNLKLPRNFKCPLCNSRLQWAVNIKSIRVAIFCSNNIILGEHKSCSYSLVNLGFVDVRNL